MSRGNHPRPAVQMPDHLIGLPVPDSHWTGKVIKIPRGGKGQQSGSGPSGWKLRPAKKLARSLADMAAQYRKRGSQALAAKSHGSDSNKNLKEAIKKT